MATDIPPTAREVPVAAPLDYEPPRHAPRGRTRDLVLGIFAVVFIAVGIGLVLFGLMVSARFREPEATLVSAGATLLTLGGGLITLIFWLRRL